MIAITTVVMLWLVHLIADFFLQSDWMALNKSKKLDALLTHTSIYATCFVFFGLDFVALTFALHTITDAITSRITSKLWFIQFEPMVVPMDRFNLYAYVESGKRHWFFVIIGVDQFIHLVALLYTYQFLRG